MDFTTCVTTRRSIKKYTSSQVPVEIVGQILDTARYAPTAGDLQNWKFIIVTDKEKKHLLGKACLEQDWILDAPVVLVICGELQEAQRLFEDRAEKYTLQNCSNASLLILLKAHDLGLAASWVDIFSPDLVREVLQLPGDVEAYHLITLGYPSEKPWKSVHKVPLPFLVRFNDYKTKNLPEFFPLKRHFEKLTRALKPQKK